MLPWHTERRARGGCGRVRWILPTIFFPSFICTSRAFLMCALTSFFFQSLCSFFFLSRVWTTPRSVLVCPQGSSHRSRRSYTTITYSDEEMGRIHELCYVEFFGRREKRIYWIFNHQMFGFAFNLTICEKYVSSGISHILLPHCSGLLSRREGGAVTFKAITHFRMAQHERGEVSTFNKENVAIAASLHEMDPRWTPN